MSARGSITLGEMVGKLEMLAVASHKCDRRGRLSVARLIADHGADTGLSDLWGTRPATAHTPSQRRRTIAAAVLALAMVSMVISVLALIGCGIAALLTRRRL